MRQPQWKVFVMQPGYDGSTRTWQSPATFGRGLVYLPPGLNIRARNQSHIAISLGWDVSYLTDTIWLSRSQKHNTSIDSLGLTRRATSLKVCGLVCTMLVRKERWSEEGWYNRVTLQREAGGRVKLLKASVTLSRSP